MKDYLEIILGLVAIVGVIWNIATVKAEIYQSIDKVKDELEDKNKETKHRLELHLSEYSEKKEFLTYRLNGIDEAIKHKFNRCWDEIKDIQGFLGKSTTYAIRDKSKD